MLHHHPSKAMGVQAGTRGIQFETSHEIPAPASTGPNTKASGTSPSGPGRLSPHSRLSIVYRVSYTRSVTSVEFTVGACRMIPRRTSWAVVVCALKCSTM